MPHGPIPFGFDRRRRGFRPGPSGSRRKIIEFTRNPGRYKYPKKRYSRATPRSTSGYRRNAPRVPGLQNKLTIQAHSTFMIKTISVGADLSETQNSIGVPMIKFAIPTMPFTHPSGATANQFLEVGDGLGKTWATNDIVTNHVDADEAVLSLKYASVRLASMEVWFDWNRSSTHGTKADPLGHVSVFCVQAAFDPLDDQGYAVKFVPDTLVIPPVEAVQRNLPYLKRYEIQIAGSNANGIANLATPAMNQRIKLFSRKFPFKKAEPFVDGQGVTPGQVDRRAINSATWTSAFQVLQDATTCRGKLWVYIYQRDLLATVAHADFLQVGAIGRVSVRSTYELSDPIPSVGHAA